MSFPSTQDSKETVVCFGCYDYWNSNPGSPVKIMDAIHDRGHRVLWINNIGMNMPRLRKSGQATHLPAIQHPSPRPCQPEPAALPLEIFFSL